MTYLVSLVLYLLLAALENFDIALDLRSRAISNFPAAAQSKYRGQGTNHDLIFLMYP